MKDTQEKQTSKQKTAYQGSPKVFSVQALWRGKPTRGDHSEAHIKEKNQFHSFCRPLDAGLSSSFACTFGNDKKPALVFMP
ncbi:MAG: hypothetical protein U1G05_09435 [Kiritimatiellia bacterium]